LERNKTLKNMRLSILIVFSITKVLGQSKNNLYEKLDIKNRYILLETLVNDKKVENEDTNTIDSYSFYYNSKKDSVVYYDLNNSYPILFVLKNEKKTDALKLFIIENKKKSDSLNIMFSNENYLNSIYYELLKKNILKLKNIPDLVDLLDDMLGDYPYQMVYLKDFSSNNKYRYNNNKILKAHITTIRNQVDDYKDVWDVMYLYNNKNILSSVIKKSKDEGIQFKKELIQSNGIKYKYKVFRNVESRFQDDNIITFNLKENTYEEYQKHFQFGLVKETSSRVTRIFYQKKKKKIKKKSLL
jgi:hypothetical protein